MSSTRKKFLTRMAWALTVALVIPGALAHVLMASGPRPAPSEFGLGPRQSSTGAYSATLVPAKPLSGRGMQQIVIELRDSTGQPVDGATFKVDGGMPAHGHGLPTKPKVTRALGEGRYQVDGVRFSMPGWWVLSFRIDGAAGTDSVTFNLKL